MLKKSWECLALDGTKCRETPAWHLLILEDEDTPFIRKVGYHLPKDIASHPRRPKSPVNMSLKIRSDMKAKAFPVHDKKAQVYAA
jgi:heat shock protein HspQ